MSFPRYESYKDSGVEWLGDVPEHWDIARLGYECDTLVPMRNKPVDLTGEIPWVRIEDFNGKYISSSKSGQGVSEETVAAMNLKVLPVGSVLCSCSCSMGATAIVTQPLVTNQTFIGIVPNTGYVSDFIFYLFISAADYLNSIGTGAIQTYLSRDDFRRLRIPKPSLSEQQTIAAFLDRETAKIDALIAEQQRLIELLKEKRQSVISHAVTKGLNPNAPMKDSGIESLGDVPEHWKTASLRWVSKRYSGGTPDKLNLDYWTDGTIPWLNSGAVNEPIITEPSAYISEEALLKSSAKWVPKGALVMALAGQGKTKGMVAQLGIKTTCNQSMAAIIPTEEIDARFLYWWLVTNYQNIRNMAGGDLRDGLNLELLGNIPCPLLPYDEQQTIAAFLDSETTKINALTVEAKTAITLLQEHRTALISAAVTGKIDVRIFHP